MIQNKLSKRLAKEVLTYLNYNPKGIMHIIKYYNGQDYIGYEITYVPIKSYRDKEKIQYTIILKNNDIDKYLLQKERMKKLERVLI